MPDLASPVTPRNHHLAHTGAINPSQTGTCATMLALTSHFTATNAKHPRYAPCSPRVPGSDRRELRVLAACQGSPRGGERRSPGLAGRQGTPQPRARRVAGLAAAQGSLRGRERRDREGPGDDHPRTGNAQAVINRDRDRKLAIGAALMIAGGCHPTPIAGRRHPRRPPHSWFGAAMRLFMDGARRRPTGLRPAGLRLTRPECPVCPTYPASPTWLVQGHRVSPDLRRRPPGNNIGATSMLLRQHRCHIDVVMSGLPELRGSLAEGGLTTMTTDMSLAPELSGLAVAGRVRRAAPLFTLASAGKSVTPALCWTSTLFGSVSEGGGAAQRMRQA